MPHRSRPNMQEHRTPNGHTVEMTGLQLLRHKSLPGAAHDSPDRFPSVRCHPATRRTVVGDVHRWFHQRPSVRSNVLWLHGPAGSGKTALAQTICESLTRTRHLGASFFFSRTAHDYRLDDSSFLFITIAYQLSLALPHLAPYIEDAVLENPTVVNQTASVQFQKLVLEPFFRSEDNGPRPTAIVIDGLDECSDEDTQIRLLESIVCSLNDGAHQLCFIITSRPSPRICNTFAKRAISDQVYPVSLARSMDIDRDIRAYISSRLLGIRDDPKHRGAMASVSPSWPGEDMISCLVESSSGVFLYAATIIKFVDDSVSHPAERLSLIASVLSTISTQPDINLDMLYSLILSLIPDKQRTLETLGAIIAMHDAARSLHLTWRPGRDALSIAENFLDLHEDDGYLALHPIRSLVTVREPAIGSRDEQDEDFWQPRDDDQGYAEERGSQSVAVQFFHRSFIEFLCNRSRAGEFFIDMEKLNARLAVACLHRLESLSLLPKSKMSDVTWGYSLLHWTAHVTALGRSEKALIEALQDFDLVGCYIATLTNDGLDSALVNDIKRLAMSPRSLLQTLRSRLWSERTTRSARCPGHSDLTRARNAMLKTPARHDITESGYKKHLQTLLAQLSVAKTGTNPSRSLCSQLQFTINVLERRQSLGNRKLDGPEFDRRWHGGVHYSPTEL